MSNKGSGSAVPWANAPSRPPALEDFCAQGQGLRDSGMASVPQNLQGAVNLSLRLLDLPLVQQRFARAPVRRRYPGGPSGRRRTARQHPAAAHRALPRVDPPAAASRRDSSGRSAAFRAASSRMLTWQPRASCRCPGADRRTLRNARQSYRAAPVLRAEDAGAQRRGAGRSTISASAATPCPSCTISSAHCMDSDGSIVMRSSYHSRPGARIRMHLGRRGKCGPRAW